MSDWFYVAMGYAGAVITLGIYCGRLVLRARKVDRP
jgi:hypothetical protein